MKKYILNVKKYICMELILGLLAAICMAFIPNCERLLLDNVIYLHRNNTFISIVLMFAACSLLGCIFTYLASLMNVKWVSSMRHTLRVDFFHALSNTSYEEFKKKEVGEYVSIETNNVDVVVDEYTKPILDMVQGIVKVIVYAIIMFVCTEWKISLLILFMSFLIIFIPKIFQKRNEELGLASMEVTGKYTTSVQDYLEGIKLVNNRTRRAIIEQHNKSVDKTIAQKIKGGTFAIFSMCMEMVGIKVMELIAFIGVAILMLKGQITAGMALAVFTYTSYFVEPLQNVLNNINNINSSKGVALDYIDTINYYKAHNIRVGGIDNDEKIKQGFKHSIKLKDICVQRENFQLSHINLEFKKGKKYAMIGHSGSGKSTILNLLMKYEKPHGGSIEVDGRNIEEVNIEYIMGCISQKEHIFSDSFRNNVTIFDSYNYKLMDMTSDICNKADCSQLSGGEKQLTALLRALNTQKDILLMDESFSDMDVSTYKKAMDIVMSLQEKTIIMVTHNLDENLQRFDEIISMANGQVIEERQLG